MVEADGSQSAWQDGVHGDGLLVGNHLFLEVELHSGSTWDPHDGDDGHEGNGREYKLGEVLHIPHVDPGEGEGGCIPLVLVSGTGH